MTRLWPMLIAIALMVGNAGTAIAAEASAPQQAAQAQQAVIRGTFTQRKYLAELEQPLESSGTYVVAAGHGLIWHIRQPIQAQLVISKQQLIRRSDGHEVARINADQQPALHIVAAILLAVFQADTDQLQQYFHTDRQQGSDSHWTLTLRPKAAAVARFIDHIRVQGAAHISHIELYQPGHDRTVIDLQPTSVGPDTLTAAEKAEFDL